MPARGLSSKQTDGMQQDAKEHARQKPMRENSRDQLQRAQVISDRKEQRGCSRRQKVVPLGVKAVLSCTGRRWMLEKVCSAHQAEGGIEEAAFDATSTGNDLCGDRQHGLLKVDSIRFRTLLVHNSRLSIFMCPYPLPQIHKRLLQHLSYTHVCSLLG